MLGFESHNRRAAVSTGLALLHFQDWELCSALVLLKHGFQTALHRILCISLLLEIVLAFGKVHAASLVLFRTRAVLMKLAIFVYGESLHRLWKSSCTWNAHIVVIKYPTGCGVGVATDTVIVVPEFRGFSPCCLAPCPVCLGSVSWWQVHLTGESLSGVQEVKEGFCFQGKMPLLASTTQWSSPAMCCLLKFLKLTPIVPSAAYAASFYGALLSPSLYVSHISRMCISNLWFRGGAVVIAGLGSLTGTCW